MFVHLPYVLYQIILNFEAVSTSLASILVCIGMFPFVDLGLACVSHCYVNVFFSLCYSLYGLNVFAL